MSCLTQVYPLTTMPSCRESSEKPAYGMRAFSVAAPMLWNNLPLTLKNATSVTIFKRALKTHLFS